MNLRDWLAERQQNAEHLAKLRPQDGAGWLEDADYFRRAVGAVDELERMKRGVCRVNRQSCDCPVATCALSRGGLRPAGVGGTFYQSLCTAPPPPSREKGEGEK
jgi:hypothetical protein